MIPELTTELERLAGALEELHSPVVAGADPVAGQGAEELARIRALQQRVATRLHVAPHVLVVGLAGTTGAGKSSLFNALIGRDYSSVGALRPTTSRAIAAILTEPARGEGPLLDWLEVTDRVFVPDPPWSLGPTVVIDLPDIDSTAPENRARAQALIDVVDVLFWVVDPEKYADSRLHDTYLRPMVSHAPVMSVVVNQADRLSEVDRELVTSDLTQRLAGAGLHCEVYPTSVVTGLGIDELAAAIARRARAKRAQIERLLADARDLATRLGETAPPPTSTVPSDALLAQVRACVGVPAYAATAADRFRYDLLRSTTWPPFRLFHRSRKAPGIPELTTRMLASPLSRFSAAFTGPGAWERALREAAVAGGALLQAQVRDFPASRWAPAPPKPRWAQAVGFAQWLGIALLLAAALTFGVEIGLRYFGVTVAPALGPVPAEPGYPALPSLRWSAVIGAAGVVVTLVVGAVGTLLRALSVRRFRGSIERAVGTQVERAVAEAVITPVHEVAAAGARYGEALATIAHITAARRPGKVRRGGKSP